MPNINENTHSRLRSNIKKGILFLVGLLAISIFVGPISFAYSGNTGLFLGILTGFVMFLDEEYLTQPIKAIFTGIILGVMAGIAAGIIQANPPGFGLGLILGIPAGFTVTFLMAVLPNRSIPLNFVDALKRSIIIGIYCGGFLLIAVFGIKLYDGVDIVKSYGHRALIFIVLGASLSTIIVLLLSIYAGKWLRPRLLVFGDLSPYLKAMGIPVFSFTFGYCVIAFLFASYFWAAWKIDPDDSFKGLPTSPVFGDFLYFSIVTICTLGYGDISPQSGMTKAMAAVEVILGIGWVTVVFGAVVAYLQPHFTDIAKQQSERRNRNL
jgi:hypothetical protein